MHLSYAPVALPPQDAKKLPKPASNENVLFFFVSILLLCGGTCLATAGALAPTWGCHESPAPSVCPCSAEYPILLGIMGASLSAFSGCSLVLTRIIKLEPTSEKCRLPLIIIMAVSFVVFVFSIAFTLVSWYESEPLCGLELYNTGFFVLSIAFSTTLALLLHGAKFFLFSWE